MCGEGVDGGRKASPLKKKKKLTAPQLPNTLEHFPGLVILITKIREGVWEWGWGSLLRKINIVL